MTRFTVVLQDPTVPQFFRTFEQHPKPELRLGVRTHPQSRVGSDQTCKDAAETNLAYLQCPRAGMLTHWHSRVESLESCRVKSLDAACFIFASRTPVIGRDGCYFASGNECSKVDAFS